MLLKYLDDYLSSRTVAPAYAQALRYRLQRFIAFCGRDCPDIFDEAALSRFLRLLPVAPATAKGYRGDLLVIWRWLADCDLCGYPRVRRVLRPQVPRSIPLCWTVEEVRELLRVAETLRGANRDGLPRKRYWTAAIRVGYEIGLRRGDLWRLPLAAVRSDGVVATVGHKTGHRLINRLSQETVRLLRKIGSPRPLAWCYDQRHFGRYFQAAVVSKADVREGTFCWLRRSSGSYVEALYPGQGSRHLGHTSAATFRQYYDSRLVADAAMVPMPPAIS